MEGQKDGRTEGRRDPNNRNLLATIVGPKKTTFFLVISTSISKTIMIINLLIIIVILASGNRILYILQPARYSRISKTLIKNIFSNVISDQIKSGNLTATASDYLTQFPEI